VNELAPDAVTDVEVTRPDPVAGVSVTLAPATVETEYAARVI